MRKDYIPVPEPTESGVGEDESLWEKSWEGRDLDVDDLDRREEFALMKPYLESLPQGAKILDGGCGLGAWEIGLSRRGYDVVGMDFCRSIVERLKENMPKCSFVTGNIQDTGFEDASFDMYFSLGVFEHFESGPGACLDEAYRILKPGGLLFITVPFQNLRHIFADRMALHR